MASELRVNTLKDAAGNNSIATSFVAGGSAKHWIAYNGSQVVTDSLNNSSITDVGSGNHRFGFTSNLSAAKAYTAGGVMAFDGDNSEYTYSIQPKNSADVTTSSLEVVTIYINRSVEGIQDYGYNCSTSNGDLA